MAHKTKPIVVRTVGKPDIELAAELLAPLFQKIHERNESEKTKLTVVVRGQKHFTDKGCDIKVIP
jgi:hypothetical protein